MKDEIKEILDKFDKVLENYELDKKWGQISVDSICHLFPNEMIIIKDYITNLKKTNKNHSKKLIELGDKITNLQEENERLKQPQIFIDTMDMEERYGQELYEDYLKKQLEDFKSRIDKAIEYIEKNVCEENNGCGYYYWEMPDKNDLLNILQGEDKDD